MIKKNVDKKNERLIMGVRLKFLGIATFQIITEEGKSILIDPYIKKSPVCPITIDELKSVDLILVSHGAFDHIGDTAEIAIKYNSKIICASDCKKLLLEQGVPPAQILETTWGLTVKFSNIRVRPVESHHRSEVTLKDGTVLTANPLGFIIYLEDGIRIYNSSDTAIFSDLKLIGELYKPHIGILNVTQPEIDASNEGLPEYETGEMTPYEAALAAQWLNLDYAIACHYTRKNCADVTQFITLLENMKTDWKPYVKPIALEPGEEFQYQKSNLIYD